MTTRYRTLALTLLAFIGYTSLTFGADADAEPDEPIDEVVVTGFRQSYANAVKAKREAIGVTDSISSEGLGRFPDLNVGEALQRVPGVQINREAESRNATINLRELPGTYHESRSTESISPTRSSTMRHLSAPSIPTCSAASKS